MSCSTKKSKVFEATQFRDPHFMGAYQPNAHDHYYAQNSNAGQMMFGTGPHSAMMPMSSHTSRRMTLADPALGGRSIIDRFHHQQVSHHAMMNQIQNYPNHSNHPNHSIHPNNSNHSFAQYPPNASFARMMPPAGGFQHFNSHAQTNFEASRNRSHHGPN